MADSTVECGQVSQRDLRSTAYLIVLVELLFLVAVPRSVVGTTPLASATDNLNGLAFLNASNGWAVGNAGTIQHFDGSFWRLIPSGTATDLYAVSFGPPSAPNSDAGFAVGGSGGSAVALFWGGVSWYQIGTGLSSPDATKLASVSAVNPTDAWAVDSISGAFWHWSGTAGLGGGWNVVSLASGGLNSVFMTGFDGWAVGMGGIIYHYTGGAWTLYSTVGTTLNSVFMLSQNEGWAVGNGGVIFHYSSGTWSGPISPAGTSQDLDSVFMVSQSEGWAVGASGTILQYLNGVWTNVSNLSGVNQNLNAVYFPTGTGWAVGDVGTIVLLGTPTPQGVPGSTWESVYLSSASGGWIVGCSTGGCGTGSGEPSILYWTGNAFTRGTALAATTDLYSVFMVNPSEGWTVGGLGSTPAILHYSGGAWTQVTSPPVSVILRSVFMLDASNGWAVGDNGVILRYSGGSWGAAPSPTANTLRSVFMLGSSDGWAVGDGGTIIRFQGNQWVTYASPTSTRLNAVFIMDSNHGWAVGSGGTILHYNGVLWNPVSTGLSPNLNSVSQVNLQEAWAVGDSATILHWTGVAWYEIQPSSSLSGNPNLNSIFILPSGVGFIVGAPSAPGSQGTILQVSTLNPIPELPTQQLVLGIVTLATLATITVRRKLVQ